jgi:hypothetical protein
MTLESNSRFTKKQSTNTKLQINNTINKTTNYNNPHTFKDIIRGIVPYNLIETITEITGDINKAKEAILATYKFMNKIKQEIWQIRCNKFIEWEQTQNISKKDKKTKNQRKS